MCEHVLEFSRMCAACVAGNTKQKTRAKKKEAGERRPAHSALDRLLNIN